MNNTNINLKKQCKVNLTQIRALSILILYKINNNNKMSKNALIGIGIIVVVLLTGGIFINSQSDNEASSRQTQAPEKPETVAESGDQPSEQKMTTRDDPQEQSELWAGFGSYKDYSAQTVKDEQGAGKTVVLFFHAPWCPFCKTADTAFLENTAQIPQGVTVLKTDYDSNGELKQKYGVTYQHTFIQIDGDGKMVAKWTGGDIDALKKNLK